MNRLESLTVRTGHGALYLANAGGRGLSKPDARTFSVLPEALVPRRRFSLPLMLWLLGLVLEGGRSVRQAAQGLAESWKGQSGQAALPGRRGDRAPVDRAILPGL